MCVCGLHACMHAGGAARNREGRLRQYVWQLAVADWQLAISKPREAVQAALGHRCVIGPALFSSPSSLLPEGSIAVLAITTWEPRDQ